MLMVIIAALIGHFKFKSMLKKCLVSEGTEGIELFEYNGKLYNRPLFIDLQSTSLSTLKRKDLEKELNELESGLVKSKHPDLDNAIIDAYKIALSKR